MVQRQERQPFRTGNIRIHEAGAGCKMLLGDLNGDGRMELLLVQPDGGIDDRYVPHQVQCLTAFDLDGRLLWQAGTPSSAPGGPGSDYPAQICDWDGDGHLEVLCVMEKQFRVLDGRTGAVKRAYELPYPEAHDCIVVANLSGGEWPGDVLLKDRYRQIWAMDQEFKVLWTHEGNTGHYPWVYDIDGDGRDEVMAGYDMLDHDGRKLWSCQDLQDHADCIWFGDVNGDGSPEIVIGGSVTVMYDLSGAELWRYEDSIESQHVALGRFRGDLPGLQIAGLDRIVRGDANGRDGLFLLDDRGMELWKEDRTTKGWLTIIEPIRGWDGSGLDYILAYRRGGGVTPSLIDGFMRTVAVFPEDGYVVHGDLFGTGREQVIVYNRSEAFIYSDEPTGLEPKQGARQLPQPKRLYSSTLYPGGEVL
ncbi:FG-GAP-like repeat-containing protein [Paenibacillus filicis]|uniref:FG-GAP-like repeat-containing protein n=1 Tax=Paenibacillus gyeongsangnamensis TaxID=3388067 RepID=A0ABT4Q2Y0_9BACL|nr:FG-GAP-like repeat-containing protein [Paenibacillus filicis]MCZ8511060.1 FG-GAP-like repeat-containing protein [Paenibacillus filicis]